MATMEERVAITELELKHLKESYEKEDRRLRNDITELNAEVVELEGRVDKLEAWRNWIAGGATAIGFSIGTFGKKLLQFFGE